MENCAEIKEGEKFGDLTVIKYIEKVPPLGKEKYLFKCVCGKEIEAIGTYVKGRKILSCGCKRGRNSLANDLTGKRFGRLVVINFVNIDHTGKSKWHCKCDCGKEKIIQRSGLISGNSSSCGCFQKENARKQQRARMKMFGDMPFTFFTRIKTLAKRRNKEFSISIKDIYQQYIKQDKKCYFTGIPIGFLDDASQTTGRDNNTASLDRIDSEKGYIIGNICFVHKDINFMKHELSSESFIKYSKLIANNFRDFKESIELALLALSFHHIRTRKVRYLHYFLVLQSPGSRWRD